MRNTKMCFWMLSPTEHRDLIPLFVCTYVWVYLHMYTYIHRKKLECMMLLG